VVDLTITALLVLLIKVLQVAIQKAAVAEQALLVMLVQQMVMVVTVLQLQLAVHQ
jgi:hypothetical protein